MNIDVFSPTYYSKTKAQTCNNQRLGSAGKIDAIFLLQRCPLRKFSMLKGQGARDQIALYASHSFLGEVEVYAGYPEMRIVGSSNCPRGSQQQRFRIF